MGFPILHQPSQTVSTVHPKTSRTFSNGRRCATGRCRRDRKFGVFNHHQYIVLLVSNITRCLIVHQIRAITGCQCILGILFIISLVCLLLVCGFLDCNIFTLINLYNYVTTSIHFFTIVNSLTNFCILVIVILIF